MIEVVVKSIKYIRMTNSPIMLLKEVAGDRTLPIWIGDFESQAIFMQLEGTLSQRPLPYDVMRAIISELQGTVLRVVVVELTADVFYARIVISAGGETIEIDSRPSDAIALALRCGAPIMVEESVMDQAGVNLDDDDAPIELDRRSSSKSENRTEVRPDDEKLSIFRDFINTLDSDDTERGRGD